MKQRVYQKENKKNNPYKKLKSKVKIIRNYKSLFKGRIRKFKIWKKN